MLCLCFNLLACLLEQVAGEDEVNELLVVGVDHLSVCALPTLFTLVDINYVFTDAHHGVHIVGVYYCCDVVLFGNSVEQFIDNEGCTRVKA